MVDRPDPRHVRTRAALFAAAVELLDVRDPQQISVTDLAERAGVTRRTLYMHFPDRDSLLQAAGLDRYEKALNAFHQDGRGGLAETARAILGHLQGHRDFYRRLLSGTNGLDTYRAIQMFLARGVGRAAESLGSTLDDSERLFLSGGAMSFIAGWLDHEPADDNTAAVAADRLADLINAYVRAGIGHLDAAAGDIHDRPSFSSG